MDIKTVAKYLDREGNEYDTEKEARSANAWKRFSKIASERSKQLNSRLIGEGGYHSEFKTEFKAYFGTLRDCFKELEKLEATK